MRRTEHPILFTGDMVQAILDERKTMTRRVIKPQPHSYLFWSEGFQKWFDNASDKGYAMRGRNCPYGQPGDTLWVKTPHYLYGQWDKAGRTPTFKQKWRFKYDCGRGARYPDDPPEIIQTAKTDIGWFLRSPLFMPRWACRLFLELTERRAEQVQDITPEDAEAEGSWLSQRSDIVSLDPPEFPALWDLINAERGYAWDTNCWVWVLTFKLKGKSE